MTDRREQTRLPLPECVVSGASTSGKIVDISSTGVGVEMRSRCVFARGELHRLVLSDLGHSVEIEGEVRWTQSAWSDPSELEGPNYLQTAGLEFSRILTDRPAGVWSSLLPATAPPVEVITPEISPPVRSLRQAPPVEAITPVIPPPVQSPPLAPPLSMIEPLSGSTVEQESISVICTMEDPDLITGIQINGVDAMVMGDMGTATVPLNKGLNRIVSMVRRRTGTYSTYLLGEIVRSRQ